MVSEPRPSSDGDDTTSPARESGFGADRVDAEAEITPALAVGDIAGDTPNCCPLNPNAHRYKLTIFLISSSTLLVLISSTIITRKLIKAGHKIPTVGLVPAGFNPFMAPRISEYREAGRVETERPGPDMYPTSPLLQDWHRASSKNGTGLQDFN